MVLADGKHENGQDVQREKVIVKPWRNESRHIHDIIQKRKENRGQEGDQGVLKDRQIVKPWRNESRRIHDTIQKNKENRGQEGSQIVKPWAKETQRIHDNIERIKRESDHQDHQNSEKRGHKKGQEFVGKYAKIEHYLKEILKYLKQLCQDKQGSKKNTQVKPWLDKLQRIQEYLGKIRQQGSLSGNDEDELQNFGNDVKPWLEKLQKIQEHLREIRQKGQGQEGEGPQEVDLEELENNVKPWLEKLQKIQEYLRKIRQNGSQHQDENEEVELEEIGSNVKPWLEKLQQIQEYLRELRQNGQPEEVEDGHPRPHLIGRRPPVGRTRAPRVPRAAAMRRTKHPMPFPDNDDRFM